MLDQTQGVVSGPNHFEFIYLLTSADYNFQPLSQKNPSHGIKKSVLVGSMAQALVHAPKVRAFFATQVLPLNERAFEFLTGAPAAGHLRAMEHRSWLTAICKGAVTSFGAMGKATGYSFQNHLLCLLAKSQS